MELSLRLPRVPLLLEDKKSLLLLLLFACVIASLQDLRNIVKNCGSEVEVNFTRNSCIELSFPQKVGL